MPEGWSIAVVGPGGVGGLLATVLTGAGHRVVTVARPQTAAALAAGGLHLRSALFGDRQAPVTAVSRLATPVDLCVLAVKATSLPEALAAVPAPVLGDALLLPLLNGFEHMAALRAHAPAAQVVAGAIRVESTRVAPGRIEHTSPFAGIDLASDTAPAERVATLADRLRLAGFEVRARADEATVLWDKLALLAPLALLTAHTGAPLGVVRDRHGADLEATAAEVIAVAAAEGARVDVDGLRAVMALAPDSMKSSMLRDVEAGRPTELDAIGGAVLRAAGRHGIAAPVTARLVAELRARLP